MYHRFIRLLLLVFLALFTVAGKIDAAPFGVQATFVHNNTKQDVNEVANNTLKVRNYSSSIVRFHVNFSLPSGWEFLGNPEKDVQLAANDSIFLPVRLIVNRDSKGGTSYIVTAWLSSDKGVQFASQNWYVTIPVHSDWKASVPNKQVYFISNVDSSGFKLIFRNNGNTDEDIRISLVPDRRLEILRQSDGGAALLSFTISLAVGTDTTLIFPVVKRQQNKNTGKKDADLHGAPAKESYSIQILAKSITSTVNWSGTVQFVKLSNTIKQNEFGRSAAPLVLEANVYDILSDGTTMSLDAYGSTNLKENSLLNYRFQTVFSTNFLDQNSFLGNNHYIGYFSNKATIELGEVNSWGRSLMTGKGLKASYILGKNTIGAIGTMGPDIFNNPSSRGLGFFHNFKNKKLSWSNYFSMQSNSLINSSGNLINSTINYKISTHHQVVIGGGTSMERFQTANGADILKGYGYDATYNASFNKLGGAISYSHGSGNYSVARGTSLISGRLNYSLNTKHFISASFQSFGQNPEYYNNGVIHYLSPIRSDRYEVRYGIQSAAAFTTLKPTYLVEENQSFKTKTKGLGIDYNLKNLQAVRVSTSGFFGYVKAVDYSLPEFFASRMTVSARWEKLFLSMRYNYGPNQITEQRRFVKDKINPQSIYIVGSYDYWMANGKVLLTTTGNMFYESYFKKINFRLRPEIYYFTKSGIRLSAYASFMTSKQSANPLLEDRPRKDAYEPVGNTELSMGFGVRKQIGIPVPGKKFISTKIIVFKDLNGNHKLDQNEEGVTDMMVNIRPVKLTDQNADSMTVNKTHGEDFITDSKGTVTYENIPAGAYSIKCNSLVSQGEWFDANNGDYQIDKKGTIYIALTKGVRLTGSLLVQTDKYSNQDVSMEVGRIRVTAIDSSGKAYSALTDKAGNFMMYVPTGIYTITINESALGSNYVLLQNKVEVDLTYFTENFSITFNAVEKKRKMNIKKFNLQGEEQK
jgi:hypothetical protein